MSDKGAPNPLGTPNQWPTREQWAVIARDMCPEEYTGARGAELLERVVDLLMAQTDRRDK